MLYNDIEMLFFPPKLLFVYFNNLVNWLVIKCLDGENIKTKWSGETETEDGFPVFRILEQAHGHL